MTYRWLLPLVFLGALTLFTACEMNDDEPAKSSAISRLYVSYSDYQFDINRPKINNISIVSNADSSDFGVLKLDFLSPAAGGSAIYFHPGAKTVFQSSLNRTERDSTVYNMYVGETGQLTNKGKIIYERMVSPRGLVFHPYLDKLYVVQMLDGTPSVLVYDRPRGIDRQVIPSQIFGFEGSKLYFDAAIVNSNLILSRQGANGGLDIFEKLISSRDIALNNIQPTRSLTVTGANNIQGVSIDTVNNVLAMTDYTTPTTGDPVGRILIFENFSEISKASGTITPTRIITGANTKLKGPTDVDLDFRQDSKYLYVADPVSKAVYRFDKNAEGDVAPNATFERSGLSPISLSLDARN